MQSCALYCNVLNFYGKLLMSWLPTFLSAVRDRLLITFSTVLQVFSLVTVSYK
jgi:hypothetical protein